MVCKQLGGPVVGMSISNKIAFPTSVDSLTLWNQFCFVIVKKVDLRLSGGLECPSV